MFRDIAEDEITIKSIIQNSKMEHPLNKQAVPKYCLFILVIYMFIKLAL